MIRHRIWNGIFHHMNFVKIMNGLICVVSLLIAMPSLSATYEETFTPKANKAYNEDINVWVYTTGFAKRFGMPEQWVDDDLTGAYAVAFRVEVASEKMLFPHKGPTVSMPIRRCILDVYIPSEANIPWKDEQIAGKWWYTPDSPTYLLPQTPEDQRWRRRAVGIPIAGEKSRSPLIYLGVKGNRQGGSLSVREFDKSIYPGTIYISLSRACVTPPGKDSWIKFMNDGGWNHGEGDESYVAHQIDVPSSFMSRLYDNWEKNSRSPAISEWGSVIRAK